MLYLIITGAAFIGAAGAKFYTQKKAAKLLDESLTRIVLKVQKAQQKSEDD